MSSASNYKGKSLISDYYTYLCVFLAIGSVILALCICDYATMSRIYPFHPDMMNYIDVARNIKEGHGIVQSTLGFNQKNFYEENEIPSQFISQPFLYPLLIYLISESGLSLLNSARLLVIFCHGLVLYLTYRLATMLYEKRVGILSVILLINYKPLALVVMFTLSEPLAYVFLLMSLIVLIDSEKSRGRFFLWFGAGILAGLAFATRYSFAPLLFLGIYYLIKENHEIKAKWQSALLFLAGYALPSGTVIVHNIFVSGHAMGMPLHQWGNPVLLLISTLKNIFVQYSALYSHLLSAYVWAALLIVATSYLLYKCKGAFLDILWKDKRYLLTMWSLLYIAFLVYSRSRFYFDIIDTRLIFPAGMALLVIWAALFVKAFDPKTSWLLAAMALVACAFCVWGVHQMHKHPAYTPKDAIKLSETMAWIAENTDEKDLIIANIPAEIPYVFGYHAAIFYSYYPESEPLNKEMIDRFIAAHQGRFKKVFLIFRTDFFPDEDFGPFIKALIKNPDAYNPSIKLIKKVKDGYIFEIY